MNQIRMESTGRFRIRQRASRNAIRERERALSALDAQRLCNLKLKINKLLEQKFFGLPEKNLILKGTLVEER